MRLPAKEGLTSHLYPQGMTGGSRQDPCCHRGRLGDVVHPFLLLSHGYEGRGFRSMAQWLGERHSKALSLCSVLAEPGAYILGTIGEPRTGAKWSQIKGTIV